MISSMIYHDIDDDTQFVSGVVDVMDSYGLDRSSRPDGSPAFIGSHNQPGDEPLKGAVHDC
jgi:hypothetical protein